MIQADDLYFECPVCGTYVSQQSLLSGNTFGARLYSDGKQDAPMLPEFPMISKCFNCGNIYWLNQATQCEINNEETIQHAGFLGLVDLQRALDENLASNREDEIYLRQRIMWLINDRSRFGISFLLDVETRVIWESNQLRLLAVLDENILNEKILIAEIFRNMGAFTKSREMINSIDSKKLDWLKSAFIENIDKKNKNVFEFRFN